MSSPINTVSTLQLSMSNRTYVAKATKMLQQAGEELSNGVKSDVFGELGARAAQLLSLRAREENTQAYITSNEILGSKLQAMLTSVDAVRGETQSVLEVALVNASRPSTGATALQDEARAALESVVATLNISYNGDYLFAGIDSDTTPLNRWNEASDATGTSPAAALGAIVGSGPTSAAEADDMIARIDAFFASANSDPAENFEGTFFGGTPLLEAGGTPAGRITARIDEGQALEYGVQANDDGFREMLKGLAMLAITDVSKISDETAYAHWMEGVNKALSGGLDGALQASADIGFNQQVVETTQTRLNDLSLVQKKQISTYESVDPYEAATMVKTLETQLDAAYSVTARLSQLSLLKFL